MKKLLLGLVIAAFLALIATPLVSAYTISQPAPEVICKTWGCIKCQFNPRCK
ncbi:MAG: hypothetical protein V1778_05320 [bacterium]